MKRENTYITTYSTEEWTQIENNKRSAAYEIAKAYIEKYGVLPELLIHPNQFVREAIKKGVYDDHG